MASILGALLVFVLRITDVSIGTLRVLYTVQGRRLVAAGLGLLEAGVFIVAISRVFKDLGDPLKMVGYACGFAAGTALGMTLEKWIGSGLVLVRLISRDKSQQLLDLLRENRFGVTTVRGEGREGAVIILFVVAARRRRNEMLQLIRNIDPQAFLTVDLVSTAIGGFVHTAPPAGVKK